MADEPVTDDDSLTEGFPDSSDEIESVEEDADSTVNAVLDNPAGDYGVDAITSGGGSRVPNPNEVGGTFPSNDAANAAARQRLGTVVDAISSRQQLARWVILQDHWYQHNIDYLSGSITIAPHPEIRVGYRLDIRERGMSFYVEGVSHNYQSNNIMSTTLVLTRGQPNNPFPVYVHPATNGFNPTPDQRLMNSRLNKFVVMPDPVAVRRSLALRNDDNVSGISSRNFVLTQGNDPESNPVNNTDTKESLGTIEKYTAAETDYVYQIGSEDMVALAIAAYDAANTPSTTAGAGSGGTVAQIALQTLMENAGAPRGN